MLKGGNYKFKENSLFIEILNKMIDTHTHLYAEEFDEDRKEAIQRALDKGITEFYLPCCNRHNKILQTYSIFYLFMDLVSAFNLLIVTKNTLDTFLTYVR